MSNHNQHAASDVDWSPVIHQLSLATGLPDADLRQGTLPYLQSIASPQDLADALLNLLGSESHALDLIQVFVQRRFPPAPPPTAAKHKTGVSYASVIAPPPPPPPREPLPPLAHVPAPAPAAQPISTITAKKSKQHLSLSQFDKLNRQGKLAPKDRTPCNCHAQSHDLLTNCLTCGRIICLAEGPGPCFTCSAPVLSSTQQLDVLAQRITSGTGNHAATATGLGSVDKEAALAAAQANQDRLLEYDATSAQRTVVIDTKADYVQYEGAGALWLSQAERDHAAKLDRARRKVALHGSAPRSGDAIKLDLDLSRGQLERAKQVEDPVLKALAELDLEDQLVDDNDDLDLADQYAWNMLENGRVVVKSRSVPLASSSTTVDQATNKQEQVGTGAYYHAGLAVRPVYMEAKPANGDDDSAQDDARLAGHNGANGKARRDRALRHKQAATDNQHTNEQPRAVVVVPGAESLAKKSADSKRKRNRGKKSIAPTGSSSAEPQEDDPGCG